MPAIGATVPTTAFPPLSAPAASNRPLALAIGSTDESSSNVWAIRSAPSWVSSLSRVRSSRPLPLPAASSEAPDSLVAF